MKALLTPEALARIDDSPHRFCPDPGCEIVYFTPCDEFTVSDVRVPVWEKQPPGERMVCYCFGESEGAIRGEIQASGTSRAVERVRAHITAGRCACELRNPRGVCCLGDLDAAVKRVAGESQATDRS